MQCWNSTMKLKHLLLVVLIATPVLMGIASPAVDASVAIPYGDVKALQAMGLLQEYSHARSVSVDTRIDWGHTSGERGEIGLIPEDHAAFLAGQAELLPNILRVALAPPPPNISHAHKPNLYWLPYLMTGNQVYVDNMEAVDKQHYAWHNRATGKGLDAGDNGRELAWSLRDLSQLAYLQSKGLTTDTHYIGAFEATRDRFSRIASGDGRKVYDTYRVFALQILSTWDQYAWTSWMESFVGQVINNIVLMGFDDWKPMAEWHFQNLIRRSGTEWPFKAVDGDHVHFLKHLKDTNDIHDWPTIRAAADASNWKTVTEYEPLLYNWSEYAGLPDDKLIPLGQLHGHHFTYYQRAQYAYGWAAIAAKVGIVGAGAKRDQIYNAIRDRGDRVWDNKNSFVGSIPQVAIAPSVDIARPAVIAPLVVTQPALWSGWDNLPSNEFVKVPGMGGTRNITKLLNSAGFTRDKYKGSVKGSFVAWVGAAYDFENDAMYIPWGGGHGDSSLNGIWKLDLELMEWSIEQMPSDPVRPGFEWSNGYWKSGVYTTYKPHTLGGTSDILPDGMPTSRHNYSNVWYDSKRQTINQGAVSWWRYSLDTKETSRQLWTMGGATLDGRNNSPAFYDEVKDVVFMGFKKTRADYYRFARISADTGGISTLPSPISNHTAAYCRNGRTIYQFASPKSGEQWAEFDMDAEKWTSGRTTGLVEYSWTQEMQGCVYVPEWGKILRQFTSGALAGKFYLYDPKTKENAPFNIRGTDPTQKFIGNKMFYYPQRHAVVYAGQDGVFVMKVKPF